MESPSKIHNSLDIALLLQSFTVTHKSFMNRSAIIIDVFYFNNFGQDTIQHCNSNQYFINNDYWTWLTIVYFWSMDVKQLCTTPYFSLHSLTFTTTFIENVFLLNQIIKLTRGEFWKISRKYEFVCATKSIKISNYEDNMIQT